MSLAELIVDAYRVKKFQIAGLPSWGDSSQDLYDVDARIPDGVAATPDEARLMLQTLLADRFQLSIHHESRLLPVYALVVSKKGLRLTPGQEDCFIIPGARPLPPPQRSKGGDTSDSPRDFQVPWASYVQALSIFTDRPVIDESGLDGAGYCTRDGQDPLLSISMEGGSRRPGEGWVYPVVEDKWGMKLEPKKAQLDVVAIDKVERPSGN